MGHWTGIKYTFKLNEEDSSYEEILLNMQEEIAQKYKDEEKSPGESFGASMNIKNRKIIYSSSGYKSRVSNDLSNNLLRKIEKNISTKPDSAYYFVQDNGENNGVIERLFGYAKTVGQYLADAGYADNYGFIGFYNEKGIEKFLDCINNKEELSEVIKEGESERLKRELLGSLNEINEYYLHKKTTPNGSYQLNEKWLAFWLVYGTDHKYKTSYRQVSDYLNVKEYLYSLSKNRQDEKYGIAVLKELMNYGVEFKEGLESIEGNFRNKDINSSKEAIENWYQQHKTTYSITPKFTKEFVNHLKSNYPETFLKLKNKLIELHNRTTNLTKKMSEEEKLNPFVEYRKKKMR